MTTYMHDIKNNSIVGQSHIPGSTITGSSADVGSYVDCSDAAAIQTFGVVMNGTVDESAVSAQAHACKLVEADDSGGTNSQDIDGTETVTLDGDSQCKVVKAYNRSKPFVAVSVTPNFTGGSTPATEFCSLVIVQKERF